MTKLHDIIYRYHPKSPEIILHNVRSYSRDLIDELIKYKDIVIDPNKNPDTYLKYILSRIPKTYEAYVFTISKDKKYKAFPLTKAVAPVHNSMHILYMFNQRQLIKIKNISI